LVALSLSLAASAQPQERPARSDDRERDENLTLPVNALRGRQLEAARDSLAEDDWVMALPLLQRLLRLKQDELAPVTRKGPDGKPVKLLVSARSEANRLLAGLPAGGLEAYRKLYGAEAGDLLKEAREGKDPEKYAQVVREYLHTEAAPEALQFLAGRAFAAGHHGTAALYFEKLAPRLALARWTPEMLFQAAASFRRAGDLVNAEFFAKQLFARVGDGDLRLGDRKLSAEEVRKELDRLAAPSSGDWPTFGGGPTRSTQRDGGMPFLVPRVIQTFAELNPKTGAPVGAAAILRSAENYLAQRNQPIIPAFFPVTATVKKGQETKNLAVYRTYAGVQAVDLKDGKLAWESSSKWSLEGMIGDTKTAAPVGLWLQFYAGQNMQRPAILFENSVLGSLSTDNQYVYAVEDLAVPPPAHFQRIDVKPGAGDNPYGYSKELLDAIRHSRLLAFRAGDGLLMWEVPLRKEKDQAQNDLDDCVFLGPPLPLGGKLYLLTEKQGELRLVDLDPAQKGKVLSVQTLGVVRDKLAVDVYRRTQAALLAYADGVLVCPTNAGAVFGVDLLSGTLLWACPYREKSDGPNPNPGMPGRIFPRRGLPVNAPALNSWKVTAPVIQDGKVVFAAPDTQVLHCVRLRDGWPVWSQKRGEDDLYLAGVFAGKVLVVGKKSVKAYGLAKGESLWQVETGMPSGTGAASDNVYYLPLKEMATEKEPGVIAIDLAKGQVVARARSRKRPDGSAVPVSGNLIFVGGDVLSQSYTDVVVYSQLKVQIARMQEALAKDPNDPAALTELGELLLEQGRLPEAIDAFEKALKNLGEGKEKEVRRRARQKLFDALTELLRRDFARGEAHLKTYEALCNVEPDDLAPGKGDEAAAETRRRKALFFTLVGTGREAQGKFREALDAYLALAADGADDELMTPSDDPAVRVRRDVWVRGRVEGLLKKATPEQRKELEAEISKRWKDFRGARDLRLLRSFVAVFGDATEVGREARLLLAERLLEEKSYREADLHLQELRRRTDDPVRAARSVELLMKLAVAQGLMEDAVYYARLLGRDYAKVALREGVTGADVLNDLTTDKRFLPYLQDKPVFLVGRYQIKEERGNFPLAQPLYAFRQAGEPLPFFQNHRVALRMDFHQLKLIDRAKGEERWSQNLTRTQFQNLLWGGTQPYTGGFPYMNVGHLVVLPVGHMAFALDPVEKKLLWERNLISTKGSPAAPGPPAWNSLAVDQRDNTVQVLYPDGWMQRLGCVLPVSPAAACLRTREGLEALDPLTGRTLWTRGDVPLRSHIFSDDEYLFVVDVGENEEAVSSRVLRMSDGARVPAPDFTDAYKKRLRQLGRDLLLSETGADKALTLRLFDPLAGRDIWKQSFAAGAIAVQSEDPDLAGAAEPDGALHVYDLKARKEIFSGKLDPKSLEKAQSVRLLRDGMEFYVFVNKPADAALQAHGVVQSNLMPATGLRGLPVNGEVYAFGAGAEKFRWRIGVDNQMLVLDPFREMPILLFTSRVIRPAVAGARHGAQRIVQVLALDKRSGKRLTVENENAADPGQLHSIEVDPLAGKIQLTFSQLRMTFFCGDGRAGPKD
jgi:outer membrane protein assembly factor BamB